MAQHIDDYNLTCTLFNNLGVFHYSLGHIEQAIDYFRNGLALARQHGYRHWEGLILPNLGMLTLLQGDYPQAEQRLQEGLNLARQLGIPEHTARLLTSLGALACVRGNYEQAEQYLREGLQLARQIKFLSLLCQTLYQWGLLALQYSRLEEAAASFEEILKTAPAEARLELSLARYGLAQVQAAQGKIAEARQIGREALTVLEAMGHREASQILRWLVGLE